MIRSLLKVYNYNIEVPLQKTSLPSELALYGLIVTMLWSHNDWEAHGCDFDEIAQPFDEIRACLTCFQAAHRALCIFTLLFYFPWTLKLQNPVCFSFWILNYIHKPHILFLQFDFSNNFNPNQCILYKNPILQMHLNPGTLIIFSSLKGPTLRDLNIKLLSQPRIACHNQVPDLNVQIS